MCRRIQILVILIAVSTPVAATAQAPGSASPSSCLISTPLVALSAGPQAVGAGATVQYDFTVTNRDSGACRATTFDVRAGVEEGWNVDLQPPSLTIAAGATSHVTLRVTSPASAAARTYYVWANVSDRNTVAHNGSAAGAYSVIPGCVLMPPTMTAAPVMDSGAPGATFVYDVTVTNHDAAACAPTSFRVLPDLSDDWKRAISPSSFVLTAGQSQTVRVALTSPRGLAPAPYSLYARATDGRNIRHAAAVELSYTLTAIVAPPRPPSALVATARPELKQIQLRWVGSNSDAGYRIMRNGKAAGVTSSTSWTDVAWRSGEAVTYYVVATDFSGRASAPSNVTTIKLSTSR
jgi:hypothetical protein